MTSVANTLNNKKITALIAVFLTVFATITINPVAAHAAAAVSGTVTESVGSKPVGGVTVSLDSATDTGAAVTTTTAADGTYSISAATSQSDWIVTFSKTGYTTQSTAAFSAGGSAVTGKDASIVTAATAATASGVVSSINAAGTVSVLSGATVVAYRDSLSTDSVTTTTDVNGAYSLSLPVGTYTLYFSKTNAVVPKYLGGASTLATASTFDVGSGQTSTQNMNLALLGSITGVVSDASGGLNSVTVNVHKADGTLVGTATTATVSTVAGTYSISNLEPGNYYVQFAKATYIYEWWNDKASLGSATAVSVTAGNATASISPTLVADSAGTVLPTPNPVPTISGTATEGLTLTAVPGTWGSGVEFDYQWYVSGVPVSGAITSTYVVKAADAGYTITVKVIGRKIGAVAVEQMSGATAAATHAFVTAPLPTISGTPAVGQTLTVSTGTWSPTPDSFTYQWYHGGTLIAGATGTTHVVTSGSIGFPVTVEVTAIKTGYPNTTKLSVGTANVGALMTTTPAPTISGNAVVGSTLTALNGAWVASTVGFAYQWKRSGTVIAGATSSTYVPTTADMGATVTVSVTASASGYATTTVISLATSAILGKLTTVTPTVSGNTVAGSLLTATPGTWTPAASLSYQWFRGGVAISGGTSATYTLVAEDESKIITVTVTGAYAGYETASATSANFLAGKQLSAHPTPLLTGNHWVGQTLKAIAGKWDTGVAVSFQWYRAGVAVAGATKSSYLLTTADVGKTITVATTGTLATYVPKTETSAASKVVLSGKPFSRAAKPTISGNARVGANLTANHGVWNPTPSKYYYQWYRNGVAIAGATKSTYKTTAADKGSFISVSVKAAKSGYATTAVRSNPTISIK